ncbi:MAG: high-affinity branched-chain amino acid ABC transporter permease LivM, partial [Gammaproteobacteria bacterium]|nr:high-affinity branched-chain amino acid ABC transporter permease LivM [Gammaproteobacteria bacterium]
MSANTAVSDSSKTSLEARSLDRRDLGPGAALPALFKDAGLAALLVLALTVALVGIRTRDVPGGLDLEFRFEYVLAACVLTFIGRFALGLLRERGRRQDAALVLALMLPVGGWFVYGLLGQHALVSTRLWLPFPSDILNVLVAAACVALGVRAGALLIGHRRAGPGGAGAAGQDSASRARRLRTLKLAAMLAGGILLVVALGLPLMPFADRRLVDIAILVATYVMLGWGLNIVVGLAGLLDLGYVAFYAVGAYSYALLAMHFDLGFWVCLPMAGILAAFAGVMLGFPVLRLRGDYLAIVTLGFGEIIRIVLLNWYQFTNGPDGISGIPRPSFFGLPFERYPAEGQQTFHSYFGLDYAPIDRIIFLYYLIVALALATNLFTLRIRRLPIGRAWEALREDEIACRSLGINPTNTKLTAFSIGAMFGGFGGAFFATRQGFISPESFTFIESAIILAIVVLGGLGSQLGVVIASVVMIGGIELLRNLDFLKTIFGESFDPTQYRMLIFGLAMVLI